MAHKDSYFAYQSFIKAFGTQTNNVFKYSLPKIKCSFFKTSFKFRVNKLPLKTEIFIHFRKQKKKEKIIPLFFF